MVTLEKADRSSFCQAFKKNGKINRKP